jgi:hypothetical protein
MHTIQQNFIDYILGERCIIFTCQANSTFINQYPQIHLSEQRTIYNWNIFSFVCVSVSFFMNSPPKSLHTMLTLLTKSIIIYCVENFFFGWLTSYLTEKKKYIHINNPLCKKILLLWLQLTWTKLTTTISSFTNI